MRPIAGCILVIVLLSACGGGGGGNSSSSTDITAPESPPATSPDTVQTQCGTFQGKAENGVIAFRGLPYAKPPTGVLRWQPPAAPDCQAGTMLADTFGAACAQLDDDGVTTSLAEDCLYLNVWTQASEFPSGLNKPVLFFIHGGGNQRGSPNIEQLGVTLYDGARLATAGDAVVITVGYRLGALGFLAHAALSAENPQQRSGNYGVLDQIAALEWVQNNIAAFGGDPQRVTIFGESGGARDVCSLVASPLASGLFAGAIMQSGGCRQPTQASAEEDGQVIADALGCDSSADATCLRNATVQQLLDAIGPEVTDGAFVGKNIGPVVDDYVLPGSPDDIIAAGAHNIVPLIIGSNAEETGNSVLPNLSESDYTALVYAQFGTFLGDRILAQYPVSSYSSPATAFIALSTDAQFICPARRLAQAAAVHSQPVFSYRFGKAFESTPLQGLGAFHGLELFYLFQQVSVLPDYDASAADQTVEQHMANLWTSFASNSDPNYTSSIEWQPYNPAADNVLLIDSNTTMVTEPRASQCDFWTSLRGN